MVRTSTTLMAQPNSPPTCDTNHHTASSPVPVASARELPSCRVPDGSVQNKLASFHRITMSLWHTQQVAIGRTYDAVFGTRPPGQVHCTFLSLALPAGAVVRCLRCLAGRPCPSAALRQNIIPPTSLLQPCCQARRTRGKHHLYVITVVSPAVFCTEYVIRIPTKLASSERSVAGRILAVVCVFSGALSQRCQDPGPSTVGSPCRIQHGTVR